MRTQLLLALLLTTQTTLPAAILARIKKQNALVATGATTLGGAIAGGALGNLMVVAWWSRLNDQEKEAAYKTAPVMWEHNPWGGYIKSSKPHHGNLGFAVGGFVGLGTALAAKHGAKGSLIRLAGLSVGSAALYKWLCLHVKKHDEFDSLKDGSWNRKAKAQAHSSGDCIACYEPRTP